MKAPGQGSGANPSQLNPDDAFENRDQAPDGELANPGQPTSALDN
jgi:hypothetical protein